MFETFLISILIPFNTYPTYVTATFQLLEKCLPPMAESNDNCTAVGAGVN